MAERTRQFIASGRGSVGHDPTGFRHGTRLERRAVEAASPHVHPFASARRAERRRVEAGGEHGIERCFDHGDVFPGNERENARRCVDVTEANGKATEGRDMFRSDDADVRSRDRDDRAGSGAALAFRRGRYHDGSFGSSIERSRLDGTCDGRNRYHSGYDNDRARAFHGPDCFPS